MIPYTQPDEEWGQLRAIPRLGACVQRDFSEQAPQSPDEALYMV
jgi:hypothetical protein